MSGNLGLITTLKRVRDQMQFYGDLHMEKTPPQIEKAAINYKFVAEINAALLAAAEPPLFAQKISKGSPERDQNNAVIAEAASKMWGDSAVIVDNVGVNRV